MKNILITERQLKMLTESQKEIDRLLDKMSLEGMGSLSVDEKNYLDAFSKHKGHADDFVSPKEKFELDYEKKGHSVVSKIPVLDGIEFLYEDSMDEEDGTKQIAGDLLYDGETFFLIFEMDENGNLNNYSASKDYMGDDDDLLNYIKEKNPDMSYNKIENSIKYFIESEIIPNLP